MAAVTTYIEITVTAIAVGGGGGGGGAVDSVDGLTGTVVLPSDGAAGVATKRTLGTGATQAAAGNHLHTGVYALVAHDHTGVYDPAGSAATAQAAAEATAAGALAAHVAAADPHTGYQKESEKAAANGYASLDGTTKVPIAQLPTGTTGSTVALGNAPAAAQSAAEATAAAALTAHEAAADPHTGYQKESEKAVANGYASLDAGTLVPFAQLGTGTATGSKFLRDDRTWAVPAGGGGVSLPTGIIAGTSRSITGSVSFLPGPTATTSTNVSLSRGTLSLILLYLPACTVDSFAVFVGTTAGAAGQDANAVVYNMAADGLPGTRVFEHNIASVSSASTLSSTATGLAQSITAGFYWVGLHVPDDVGSTNPTFTSVGGTYTGVAFPGATLGRSSLITSVSGGTTPTDLSSHALAVSASTTQLAPAANTPALLLRGVGWP